MSPVASAVRERSDRKIVTTSGARTFKPAISYISFCEKGVILTGSNGIDVESLDNCYKERCDNILSLSEIVCQETLLSTKV